MAGTATSYEIAKTIGASRTSIIRFACQEKVSFKRKKYSDELRKQVIAYYEEHGMKKTESEFPEVNVKGLLSTSTYKLRHTIWRRGAVIEAAKMAGILSLRDQAKLIGNPNTKARGVRAMWQRMGMQGSHLHGLHPYGALLLLKSSVPKTIVQYSGSERREHNTIILWCDMQGHFRESVPEYLRDGIRTLAKFQAWLYGTDDPGGAIRQMLADAAERA